ncbi:unnamed protein product [Rotaria sordida]|uniref:HTH psq-type domain-containing protein n=1 Tax=Rotaria sordida TaxID=392033 RepID=A0A814SE72_9BILA|nr:unnamed protein product [Rotaria sordida]CAF1146890.1 unnamed protein product [Rotaria sordida]
MTECFSARCQQDRKLVRREFNKWTKNLLFQIGLETITKNHFDFDVNVFNQTDDERIPIDFNPEQECLFCINRQEYLNNKKRNNQINEHHHPITETIIDDDENAPLDLSLKSSTNNLSLITSNSRTNIKHRPLFDMKSDIPTMYGQEELDRFMSDMIASQLDFSSQSFLNMNLFPTSPTIPLHYSQTNKKSSTSLQDTRIAQLAKQMAYERMLQEIDYQRYSSTNKKSKISNNLTSSSSSSSILTESIHVNHILNDVMMRILHEMFEKQQTSSVSQPRASRKGELLFVKKQNVNNDEQYNTNIFNHFNNNYNIKQQQQQHKHNNKVNPSSSSSSSTSSVSSTRSSSIHIKNKHKTKLNQSTNYIPKGRSNEIINNNNNNNNKVMIGTDGKQIRPKRGQYRRYESEQLAKAVAAVLSNEMSVHKAGSFFGVPHSTLEYKVKERNIKASSTTKSKNESTSSISINDNDNNNNNIHHGENNDDDDDDKSSKELTTCLPPSNSSTNNDHQDTIDDENESNDDDDNDLEE